MAMSRLVFAGALLAGACMTTGEGEKLKADIKALEQRVETGDRDLAKATADAKEQVVKLREMTEQATKLLERNTADAGLQISRTQTDLTALQGRVDEISHHLEQIQRSLAQARTADNRPVAQALPTDAETLWSEGNRQLNANAFDDARRMLRSFVENYPNDKRASQALYLLGDSYYRQEKFAAAIGEYQKVIDRYTRSPQVEDAMYKIGLAFLELKYCSDARTFLSEVLKRYPRSKHERAVKSKLGEIERGSRNKRVCAN
jgi:tol-pal system protein YbgF